MEAASKNGPRGSSDLGPVRITPASLRLSHSRRSRGGNHLREHSCLPGAATTAEVLGRPWCGGAFSVPGT
ncbi:hypothetical protein E2C01_036240 [Portunus trituberculatus]|uniref:Uncharacterized protein n=1 Tax=Portunus trituberculatus TaxID=210409 RepID=A0A5B7FBE5_PORTR|nr:hypothetical protein [Portunus trituberculatus]